jgi:hypothetical protein
MAVIFLLTKLCPPSGYRMAAALRMAERRWLTRRSTAASRTSRVKRTRIFNGCWRVRWRSRKTSWTRGATSTSASRRRGRNGKVRACLLKALNHLLKIFRTRLDLHLGGCYSLPGMKDLNESKSEWREELEKRFIAETNRYFAVRLQQKIGEAIREARKQTEIERQEALEEFGIDVGDRDIPPIPTNGQGSPETAQESIVGQKGSPGIQTQRLPSTRREMIVQVIPEFRGEGFSQSDVRSKILDKWPEAKARSLGSGIANLLKEMADEGYLERLGGHPLQYREKPQNQEGTLNMGP